MKTRKFMRSLLAVATLAGSFTIAGRSASAEGTIVETQRVAGDAASAGIGDPYGIAVAANGDIYVADRMASRIVKFAPGATNWTLVTAPTGAGDGLDQVFNPTSLTFNAAGDLIISDAGNNRILRWVLGASSATVIAGGSGGAGLDQLLLPGQVAFGANGEMYVADSGNNRIMRFDSFGAGVSGTVVAGGNGDGNASNQLSFPLGVHVDQTGADPNVYISDTNNQRVVMWVQGDTTGTVVAGTTGVVGFDSTHFSTPQELTFEVTESGTNIYVADRDNCRIALIQGDGTLATVAGNYDIDGNPVCDWVTSSVWAPLSAKIYGGQLYISEYGRISRWDKWDLSGGVVLMGATALPTPIVSPYGDASAMQIGPDGGAYVADGDVVRLINPNGGISSIFIDGRGAGTGLNTIGYAGGLLVDAEGSVFISDSGRNRVVKWALGATEGVLVAGQASGVAGPGVSQLDSPRGIDVGSDGSVYVADFGNHRVVRWANGATEGTVVAGGTAGAGLDQLQYPYDVKVGSDGSLYVADFGNHRVMKFQYDANTDSFATTGSVVAGGNGAGVAPNQLGNPQYIAVDSSDGVYASSAQTASVKYWAAGSSVGTLVFGNDTVGRPLGIDVDPSGRAWVMDMHQYGVVTQVIDANLAFGAVTAPVFGDDPITMPLTARVGAYPVLSTSTPAVCDIQSGKVRLLAAGTCSVTATMNDFLWKNTSVSTSFAVTAPTTTTTAPTTTTPPTTVAPPDTTTPPTTVAPPTTTTPPTTVAPPTTTTPPTTVAPVPAGKTLSAKCVASGKYVKCTASKPSGIAKTTKVLYQVVCTNGKYVKSAAVRSAATRVTLTAKTVKGTWTCTATAISGSSRWTKSARVTTR